MHFILSMIQAGKGASEVVEVSEVASGGKLIRFVLLWSD